MSTMWGIAMTRDLAEAIVDALHADEFNAKLFENYSGRGMYGRTTTGIELDGTLVDVLSAIIAHAHMFVCEGEAIFCGERLNQDQLGLGHIIY